MRHEQIAHRDSYATVDIAAVWPASAQVAPVPIAEVHEVREPQMPTPAAPDVLAAVGKLIVGSYLMLLGTFELATVASSYSIYNPLFSCRGRNRTGDHARGGVEPKGRVRFFVEFYR